MALRSLTIDAEGLDADEPSQLQMTWRRFARHKMALLGLVMLSLLIVLCALAPWIAPYDPNYMTALSGGVAAQFQGPSAAHWFGTDEFGRDILSRILYAGRISLTVGILTTLVADSFGTFYGLIAGYFGGKADTLMMRAIDLLLAVPAFPILLVASRTLNTYVPTLVLIIAILSILGWLGTARLVRGAVLAIRDREFIEATRALGAGNARILLRHLLPNCLAPIIVASTLNVGNFIISESALSFLGFGIQPPTASWGNMLSEVNDYFLTHPLLAFYPGLAILLTVVAVNFMGDALRDALDPRL